MDRREFLGALTSSLLAAPLAGEAQPAKVARVGYPSSGVFARTDPFDAGLLRGLREQGYTEGQNLALKTAKALGLTIPPAVLARADEAIQ